MGKICITEWGAPLIDAIVAQTKFLLPGSQECCNLGGQAPSTTVWLQQTVRSSCWSLMFNGIWPDPTNKRFNSAYLQIKYLIFRKIQSNTLLLDKTFLCSSQVTMMFQNKISFEKKKSEGDFQLATSLPSPPSKKNK